MRCEHGICLHCEKKVMDECPTCHTKKPNEHYTEVQVELSNKSRMALAVCLGCKDKIFEADKKEVMKAVRDGWHKEHERLNWPKEKREHYWKSHGEGVLEIAE